MNKEERDGKMEQLKGSVKEAAGRVTKKPELEDADAVRVRIDEAARFVPLDRLALSPQCGFASVLAGNRISPAEQAAKLALVSEIASKVWG